MKKTAAGILLCCLLLLAAAFAALGEELALPAELKEIGAEAFQGDDKISKAVLPDGLETIGDRAFQGCANLSCVYIPANTTQIGEDAFSDCPELVIFGQAVSAARDYAENNGIPFCAVNSKSTVDYGTCGHRIYWTLDRSGWLTVSGTGEMAAYEDGGSLFAGDGRIKKLTIKAGVSSVSSFGFKNCENLTYVEISGTVDAIGESAFEGCTALGTVKLENGVRQIGARAFLGSTKLYSVTFPTSVTQIDGESFQEGYPRQVRGGINSYSFEWAKTKGLPFVPVSIGEIVESVCEDYGLNWTLDSDGVLTLTASEGYIPDYASNSHHKFRNNSKVKYIIFEDITNIGDYAFYGCDNLIGFYLSGYRPVRIGKYAFSDCEGMTGFYSECDISCIDDCAFEDCKSLARVDLSDCSMTEFGNNAFAGCSSLTRAILPAGLTAVSLNAFYDCSSLLEIVIPDHVTSIEINAFADCTGLAKVILPDSLTTIGNCAFFGCASLPGIVIPEHVTKIGNQAFFECAALAEITIPASVTKIGRYAFEYCTSLLRFQVAPENQQYASFEGVLFDKAMTKLICYPCGDPAEQYQVPDGVTSISAYAFAGCARLREIDLPDSLTEIQNNAFLLCTALQSMEIPYGVTKLVNYTFYDCASLTDVTIPVTVTTIERAAFYCREERPVVLTIHGEKDSYAQTWAEENGFPFEKTFDPMFLGYLEVKNPWLTADKDSEIIFSIDAGKRPVEIIKVREWDTDEVIALLRDDGEGRDKKAGDGIYSGSATVNYPAGEMGFWPTCESAIGGEVIIEFMEEGDAAGQSTEYVINTLNEIIGDESDWMVDSLEEANAFLDRLEEPIHTEMENGNIQSYYRNKDNIIVTTSYGISLLYNPIIYDTYSGVPDAEISVYEFQPQWPKFNSYYKVKDDFFDMSYAKQFKSSNVTRANIKKYFTQNSVIIWASHGSYDAKRGPLLPTADIFDGYRLEALFYQDEIYRNEEVVVHPLTKRLWISAAWLNHNLADASLSNSFVFLLACSGARGSICSTLIQKGAACVIGFDDTVSVGYARAFLGETILNLWNTDPLTNIPFTANEAFSKALFELGNERYFWDHKVTQYYDVDEHKRPFFLSRINPETGANAVAFYNENGGAQFKLQNLTICRVKFNSDGGGSFADRTYSFEEKMGQLPIPDKAGYTFLGWSTSSKNIPERQYLTEDSKVYADLILYAHYEKGEVKYEVTCSGNGGTPGSTTIQVKKGQPIGTMPTVTRNGYILMGWNTKADGTGTAVTAQTVPTGNMTVYAMWMTALTTYTVNFDGNGLNMSLPPVVILKGQSIGTLPSVTRNGYILVGWNTKSDGTGTTVTAQTVPTSNMIVYAVWDEAYTFTDRSGNIRTTSKRAFATGVIDFAHGTPWTTNDTNKDPQVVLGLPDFDGGESSYDDLTLGAGGVLIVEFDVFIYDGSGADLCIFEDGPVMEAVKVELSDDLETWYNVGTASGSNHVLDIAGKVPEQGSFRYMRITDLKTDTSGNYPGADIDALCALNYRY